MTPTPEQILERAAGIQLLALDVDGVLTDGRLYYTDAGDEIKAFSTMDGHGIKQLQKVGIEVALITGRRSDIVTRRASELGIRHVTQGQEGKLEVLDALLARLSLAYNQTAYIGDDWPDLPCVRRVALGVTVPDAHPELHRQAFCVTSRPGGNGAVREVCDWILKAGGHYEQALEASL